MDTALSAFAASPIPYIDLQKEGYTSTQLPQEWSNSLTRLGLTSLFDPADPDSIISDIVRLYNCTSAAPMLVNDENDVFIIRGQPADDIFNKRIFVYNAETDNMREVKDTLVIGRHLTDGVIKSLAQMSGLSGLVMVPLEGYTQPTAKDLKIGEPLKLGDEPVEEVVWTVNKADYEARMQAARDKIVSSVGATGRSGPSDPARGG